MDAETIIQTKNEVFAELHKDIFLTPKGMMKLVQLVIVICAFALTTSASGTSTLRLDGPTNNLKINVAATVKTSYSFGSYSFKSTITPLDSAKTNITGSSLDGLSFRDSYVSESQFYVFVGVISFLYILAIIVCYGWFNKIAKHSVFFNEHFTKIDFLMTVLLTVFWFLATTVWSAGFSALRAHMNAPHELVNLIKQVADEQRSTDLCPGPQYTCIANDTWSKLYGSVIFGYLTVLLFAANCWYCFKDTEWHAEPGKLGGILRIRTDTNVPQQAPPNPAPSSPASGGTAGLSDVDLETGPTIQPGAI